jgi:hypothetical protein
MSSPLALSSERINTKKSKNYDSSKSMRQLFAQIVSNSTSQALLKIFDSPSVLIKFFWSACMLSACTVCSYFVVAAWLDFFRYEVNMETRVYTETSSLFPKGILLNF